MPGTVQRLHHTKAPILFGAHWQGLITEAKNFGQSKTYLAVGGVWCGPISDGHSLKQGTIRQFARPWAPLNHVD